LTFKYFKEFFPENTKEENIKTYSILGGVPFYLEKFDGKNLRLKTQKSRFYQKEGCFMRRSISS